ncbi:MAG: ATP-binding protein [Bryobacteraceae bacterium]|jgi:hypothetical protein
MTAVAISEAWNTFRNDLAAQDDRLATELAAAWVDASSLVQAVTAASPAKESVEPEPSVESLQRLFDEDGKRLLVDPLSAYKKRKPYERALSAIQNHAAALDDLVRQLPVSVSIPGSELAGLAGPEHGASWRARWLRWQRSARAIPLRTIVADHLERRTLRRAKLDGAFQLTLAQSCLHLADGWQICRRQVLTSLADPVDSNAALERQRERWLAEVRRRESRAAALLEEYRAWADSASAELARAVLWASAESSSRVRRRRAERYQRYLSFWARQQRTVDDMLDLELQLSALARESTQQTLKSLGSLRSEHDELLTELDSVIAWLQAGVDRETPDSFPKPVARLVSAEERVSEWSRSMAASAAVRLPTAIEGIEPRRSLPGWRTPWRPLQPARIFLRTLEGTARKTCLRGFREAESAHRAIVRDIERAREVVMFGFETAASEEAGSRVFLDESTANALSLLLYQRRLVPNVGPIAERAAARAEAALFHQTHVSLELSRIGFVAHLTRQRGLRAWEQARRLIAESARIAAQRTWRATRDFNRWFLLKIGWTTPPRPRLEPVTSRAHLGTVLDVQLGVRELPMLYRRLFRLAPVEDQRFLVGRDPEMSGLAEVLALWEARASGSVLIVGARGSGKTSLLNCAVSNVFSGVEVARGQFCRRLKERVEVREFLGNLLGLPDGADLVAGIAERRRVVIIEELERTFLRVVNGLEALKELFDLMYSTAHSTLWVFSINEAAFKYLDAVTGLGRHFSQRINAMSVQPEALTKAIMQRHNLSGLRLEFAPLPIEDPRMNRLRRALGIEQDPERLFFDALYLQSEGVFRSAFELWQGCIERVEGGVIHMRQPLAPDYRPLMSELALEDYFALQAILHHGSITADEITQVLRWGAESATRRLERLRALEVVEPEPDGPGLRIRPEAARFVRDALHRRNLT